MRSSMLRLRALSTNVIQRASIGMKRLDHLYDYVIVGGGSAGCVLAKRLTDSGNTVAVIETGKRPSNRDLTIRMPGALAYNMFNDDYNYCYYTVPQKHLNNREIYCPRGKIFGGSSSINGMVFVRGHPADFNRWEKEGVEGWSFKDVLHYFMKLETSVEGNLDFRGKNGPLRLSRVKNHELNELHHAFLRSCNSSGIPYTEDFNGYCQEGVGRYDRTILFGKRNSTYQAYISDWISEDYNKTLFPQHRATKIMFEGNRAVGVRAKPLCYEHFIDINARKEVILCAGAIDSPKLLMLSGVGDPEALEKLDINPIIKLPGVGKNLQDHLEFYIQHKCTKPLTLFRYTESILETAKAGLEWLLFKQGPGASGHLDLGAFTATGSEVEHPDVQIHFVPYFVLDHGRNDATFHGFQMHIGTLRPQSKGTVTLKSKDCLDKPIIDPNYLDCKQDLEDLKKCVHIGRNIFSQNSMTPFLGDEIQPGYDCQTDEEIEQFVRKHAETAYHPSCTCKMGPIEDPMSVLTSDMKVIGAQSLRVVDASAMPSITSGNLNAVVIMMAEKAADMILKNKSRKRDVSFLNRSSDKL